MKNVDLTYSVFKTTISDKTLFGQYAETSTQYHLFAIEAGCVSWECTVLKDAGADVTDFEANHKANYNEPIPTLTGINTPYHNGMPTVRAESRPTGTLHYFTSVGDAVGDVGGGTRLEWDFANSTNDITPPTNFKKKRIDVTFNDSVYPKEGALYFHNASKGSYVDFKIMVPNGRYYKKHDGSISQASGEVELEHYVQQHPMQGSVPMGDELNTESASVDAVPAGFIFRLEVTVPDSDTTSNGVVELEMFRTRSCLHPGETV